MHFKVRQVSIKTGNQSYIELDCLVGRCFQDLPRYNYEIPVHWLRKYKIKQSSFSAGGPNQVMIGIDQGLVKGALSVKGSVQADDFAPPTKFLSYLYHTSSDSIQVRPKVNWSKKRRGARTSPDVRDVQGLRTHMKENPITKRACLAITMGTLHDPLYLMAPYNLNLKVLYRKVVQLGLDWDQKIHQNL